MPARHSPRRMAETLDAYIDLAQRLADISGAIARRYFRTRVAIDDKDDSSPVTIADREAEAAMRALIAQTFPAHGIIGEEHGSERADASHVWVLDPIDGTKAFITGRPMFGSLIALCRDGKPVVGLIDCPALNERWVGASGRPTTHLGKPVHTRACDALGRASLSCTSPLMFGTGISSASSACARRSRRRSTAATASRTGWWRAASPTSSSRPASNSTTTRPSSPCSRVRVVASATGRADPLGLQSDGRVVAWGDARTHAQALKLLA